MKNYLSNKTFLISLSVFLSVLFGCSPSFRKASNPKEKTKYYVAAYVWPSRHNDVRGQELLWSEGIGEWEMIQKGNPRFEGHYQPRIPLWGYETVSYTH